MSNWFSNLFSFAKKPTPTPGKPDTSIVSVERSTFGGGLNMPRYNPDELVRKKGLSIFAKMRLDEQVKAVVTFKRDAILSRGWTFEWDTESKLSETERDTRKRVFEQIIARMPGSFIDALNVISLGREYGFSLTEKQYAPVEIDGKMYTGLEALHGRDPQLFEFRTDEYGVLQQCEQVVGGRRILIDLDKFIHYVHNPEFDSYFGQSELREAYRSWFMKDVLLKYWAFYMEKLGGGMVVANVSPEANIRVNSPEYRALQNILANMKATAGIVMPSGVTAEVVFPTNSDAFERACQYHDAAIAKALLVPSIGTGVGASDQKSGTGAQSQTQLEAFAWTVRADTDRLQSCIDDQLFRDLGDQNWGDGEYPRFVFKPLSTEGLRYLITTWGELIAKGAVIPTEDDEMRLREILEMPPRDEKSKTLQEVKQELMPEPPPGAPGIPNSSPGGKPGTVPDSGSQAAAADAEDDDEEEEPKKTEMSHVVNVHGGITAEQLSRILDQNNRQLVEAIVDFGFNPDQERDPDGKFAGGGKGGGEGESRGLKVKDAPPVSARGKLTIQQAAKELEKRGLKLKPRGYDAKKGDVTYEITDEDGNSKTLTAKELGNALKGKTSFVEEVPQFHIVAHTPTGEPRTATKYAFTRALLRVEFSVIEHRMTLLAHEEAQNVSRLTARATKRVLADDVLPTLLDQDVQDIADLKIDGTDVGRIKAAMKSTLQKAWELGQTQARKEMSRAGKPITFAALRNNAQQYFDANGFRMAGNLTDGMKALIQQELLQAVKKGTRPEEVQKNIYVRLIEKGMTTLDAVKEEVGGDIADQVEDALELVLNTANVPAYINTLVRTNTFEALNEARYAEFTDPALSDFILALEYSAVLDDVTTEICRHLDGKVYASDSELWDTYRPPNHYNCRSVLVPVTVIDGWDGKESPEPKLEPAVGFRWDDGAERCVFHTPGGQDHDQSTHGDGGGEGGDKVKLPKAVHVELIAGEADTLDDNSPEGKKELVKQLRAGKEISGKGLEYLKKQLPYHIDKLKDEVENGDKSFRPALNAMKKLQAELSGKKFSVHSTEPQTLYVCRPVENAEQIIAWARSQGFETTLPPEDLHVTIAYSKKPVDWNMLTQQKNDLRVAPSLADRGVQYLGDKGAIVLKIKSPELTMRWSDFVSGGASWDYDGYQPHVTLTYQNPNGINPKEIMPYSGEIILGPEIWDTVDEEWNEKIQENPA